MVGTDGCSGSISQNAVNCQNEIDDRVTTSAAGERIPVSACSINGISVPVVWKLVGTDGCPGSISENAVYGQNEINDRVTTSAAG